MAKQRDVQYRHESRKKEQELDKMKDRMHRLIAEKSSRRIPGYFFHAFSAFSLVAVNKKWVFVMQRDNDDGKL